MARDRKRRRRTGGPGRPLGTTPPQGAGGLGLPSEARAGLPGIEPEPTELDVDAFEDEAMSSAADAFGVEPAEPRQLAPAQTGNRALVFLRGCWAELQRVQWPDRRQVAQATGVVLGFVVVAGAFLGLADWVSQKIVNAIL